MRGFALAALAALLLGPAPRAAAQGSVNYGSVAGTVTDTTGAVIPGAAVEARERATSVATTATTDREGRFRLAYLSPGDYDVAVSLTGFQTATRRLTLSLGSAFDLPITLAVGGVSESVQVDEREEHRVETARAQVAAVIRPTEIAALPLNGRNFLDIALLAPGVSPTNVGGGTQVFPETSAVPGVGISVSSQRNLSNNFMVDGLSANDDAAALSGIAYSVDAVDQFQIVTSGGQAELGRALGGQINVATRSGTNRFRADGYGFFRDDRFNGVNPLLSAKLPMHQNQYGGSAGGPFVPGTSWYFANVERRRLDQSGLTTIGATDPTVVDRINARLGAVGYAGPPVRTGVFDNPIDTSHALGKIEVNPTRLQRLTLRYSLYDVGSENARGAGSLSAPSASSGLDNRDQTIALSHRITLSDRAVWETRGQYARGALSALPTDPIGPAVTISGVATFGTLSTSPAARDNSLWQVVSNLSVAAGGHVAKLGVDFLRNDDTITFPRAFRGTYTFSNLTNFLNGVYNNSGFTQTFGESVIQQDNPNLGIYVQDEWRVRSGLTINAGLRYDLQWLQTIDTDRNNISPRLGVVWAAPSRRMAWRATAGRFYDRIPLRAVANALLSAGNTTDLGQLRQIAVSLSPNQSGAPVFPNILQGVVPTTTLVNFTTIDRRLQNAHSDQAGTEVEVQLDQRSTISIGYDHLRGRQLIMQVNQNVPSCAVSGSNNGCRPNPAYANNNQYSSVGKSDYNGLHISFVQSQTKWGIYRVSYTYAKSMNNVGEAFFNAPIDPFDLDKDWARSDDDQRHRLVVSGAINTPMYAGSGLWQKLYYGFQLSWMVQYYSALPFNITTGANTLQGTAARPVVDGAFIPRNAGGGSDFSTTSLRFSRRLFFHTRAEVELLAEAFNLFDRRNDLARVTVFGTGAYPDAPAANFNTITVVGEPRAVQFGLRMRF